jgi:manganese/iron transport system ATP-binding protein
MPIFFTHATHAADEPALEVSDLSVVYGGHTALDGISFRLEDGERLAVVGPNGAGKSTLFKAIAGIMEPTRGSIRVSGSGPSGHICIAYLPQSSLVDRDFPVTVADVVMMGRAGKLGPLRRPGAADRKIVYDSLEVVGMAELMGRRISELSGGQQQRMLIARALAQEAHVMVMDEPMAGLDLPAQEEIVRVLDELHRLGVTVLLSTHDLTHATQNFERVMLLNVRMLGFGRPEEVFTPERLSEAYGSHLQIVRTERGMMILADTCCSEGEGR